MTYKSRNREKPVPHNLWTEFSSRLWCLIVKLSLSHWYPGSGVVLVCIDSWSLSSFFLFSSNWPSLKIYHWNLQRKINVLLHLSWAHYWSRNGWNNVLIGLPDLAKEESYRKSWIIEDYQIFNQPKRVKFTNCSQFLSQNFFGLDFHFCVIFFYLLVYVN